MLLRLGLAILVSCGLALLLAWGWHSSDRQSSAAERPDGKVTAAIPLR